MTTGADDIERLIQQVLSELGLQADAQSVIQQVRRLDQGLPAEDEFTAICAWLGKCQILHKLDQHQSPTASRDVYQVPDILARFDAAGPVLIEVKSKQKRTLSFTPEYLGRLSAYADMVGMPLLIAWKHHSVWTLFEVSHLRKAQKNFNISFSDAIKQNLLGVLVGDVAYKLAAGAGVVFDCRKEELLSTSNAGDTTTEQWQMRIDRVAFTCAGGVQCDDLHPDVQALFATWDLEEFQTHSPNYVRMAFQAGSEGMLFSHMALVHLLNWGLRIDEAINWRHVIRRDNIVANITNFAKALDRALEQGVVSHIFHQQPQRIPHFVK